MTTGAQLEAPIDGRGFARAICRALPGNTACSACLYPLYMAVIELGATRILELGTQHGHSAAALLFGAKETGGFVVSCDPFENPKTPAGLQDLGQADRWCFVKMRSQDLGPHWQTTLDLIFVDSSHKAKQTAEELELFAPHVRVGGQIYLHDTVSYEAGVWEPVVEYVERKPRQWDAVNHTEVQHGLGIMTRKAAVNPAE